MRSYVGKVSSKTNFDLAAMPCFEEQFSGNVQRELASAGLKAKVVKFAPLWNGFFAFSIKEEGATEISQYEMQKLLRNAFGKHVSGMTEIVNRALWTKGEIDNFFTATHKPLASELAAQIEHRSKRFGHWGPSPFVKKDTAAAETPILTVSV
ncbi:MAG TPA: hypothetical protein PKX38_09320 [Alphaproteobacteria bacterium]|nr:hypothetical protein [Micavibrio sp.]MBK9562660.1 hypothetical protein [Micavibrio sp.]HQX28119.1 hypothetical protein [Alphaproteobacteria bacterium]